MNTTLALTDLERLNRIERAIAGSALDADAPAQALVLVMDGVRDLLPPGAEIIIDLDTSFAHLAGPASLPGGAQFGPQAQARLESLCSQAKSSGARHLSYEADPAETTELPAIGCFPLLVGGDHVGALSVALPSGRRFSRHEVGMLELYCNHACLALSALMHKSTAHRDLARTEEELNRLRRAGLLISSRLGLEETLESILQMALEVTGAHYGIFRLVDQPGTSLITRAIAGENLGQPRMEALPIDDSSVMGWVALRREPVCIRDLREEPWGSIYYPLDADLEMRSELAVPLVGASGRLEGILNLESPSVGAFTDQDSHLLQSLATQAVIAIQEVRLLDALQQVAEDLLSEPCERVLQRLVGLACSLLNATASAVWMIEDDRLVLQAANAGYRRGESLPLHGSLTGQVVLANAPVRSDNLRTDPRFHRPDLARDQNWARALIVPLMSTGKQEPVGAFSVYSVGSEPGRFTESEWDEKVLTSLAHYAALAVHNAARQAALRYARERHDVAETFAAVGDIAANLLHHLNNKVGTIPVRVQGIRAKSEAAILSDLYLAANLDEIERSALEAMESVRESLAHLHPIHMAPVDVAGCVQTAISDLDPPEGIEISLEFADDLRQVWAGHRSLALVFANLIENAVTAMHGKGSLSIRGTPAGEWVRVEVEDDGPGIPLDLQDRVFEFSFSDRGQSRPGKLGFGLWWVKTLVVRLGGSVSLRSDGHHGTAFRLMLPRVGEGAGGANV